MQIIIEREHNAQSLAGRLIWNEVPFKVHYTKEGKVVFTFYYIIPEYVKLYQGE